MRRFRAVALGASALVLLSACATGGGTQTSSSPGATTGATPGVSCEPATGESTENEITIGSAGFYEAQLMGEIYAQALEANGFTVTRELGIGPRPQTYEALRSGRVDLVPEYSGSLLSFLNLECAEEGAEAPTGDPDQTHAALTGRLEALNLAALAPAPAQDQNTFVVPPEVADEYGLETMSDVTEVAGELTWGLPPECADNPVCGPGLLEVYGIDISELDVEELAACDTPIAVALDEGQVDIGQLCSTQPDIQRFGLVVLEDDQQLQPAENIVPIVRADLLEANSELADTLDAVSAELTTEELLELGVRVAVDQEDIADVAADWLSEHGITE